VTGFTVSGTFTAESPIAAAAFDSLTEHGAYDLPIARGHQMQISRKGGAYHFDGWFRMAPPEVPVYNPAFDVTPASYVTAIITECGVARPEFAASLVEACAGAGALNEIRRG